MDDAPVLLETLSRPGEPTEAPPGSEVKIRIMTERAARGEPLFHPLDGLKKAGHAVAGAPGTVPWWPVGPAQGPPEVAELLEPPDDVLDDELDDAAEEAVIPLLEYTEQANSA
ncbi:MAG TPA: hypothetical protein VG013_10390 [Gemmataceae bacterium]|jgi:hypothetical protein|nr:hypothetical protein [Gemmataceae bacterium]